MKVIVQKFGGTCVDSEESEALSAERIMEAKDQGLHPVAVISAMGRRGQPYSTVELVNLVTRMDERIDPRTLDMVMSCGEIISTAAMAHLLRSKGYETIALTGGQVGLITDSYYGHAQIIRLEPSQLLSCLQAGQMVFVAGFQGVTEDHALTTLGEGGSDYTAVALAMIINQTEQLPFGEELELAGLHIFKEVDGVLTANPTSFPPEAGEQPRPIPSLTYDEGETMARLGAEVLQHRAAAMARKYQVPIIIRNFRSSSLEGTRIPGPRKRAPSRKATAVADQANLLVFAARSDSPRLGRQLGERMDRDRLRCFQLTDQPGEVRFAVKQEKYRNVSLLLERIFFERALKAEVSESAWALVSMVGEGLRSGLGEARHSAQEALHGAGVEPTGTVSGEISLSYLVPEEQRKAAVLALHQGLI
jgi:aspartate kinase